MPTPQLLSPAYAVCGQLHPADFDALAAQGFKAVICHRPEGEEPDQPSATALQAAATAAGLTYRALPFQGAPTPQLGHAMAQLLADLPPPVLGFCRSGARSAAVWQLAQTFKKA